MISIITVCLNSEINIEKTVKSLSIQTYKDYEYIIIDGGSVDNTINILERYKEKIENFHIYSQPDDGIYDAMNKGVEKASGNYILFLNSGDCLVNKDILKKMSCFLKTGKDIYYGDRVSNGIVYKYPPKITLFYLIYLERMLCHQSILTKKEVLLDKKFNLSYRICADREWLIRCILDRNTIEYMDMIICDYDTNGVSTIQSKFDVDSFNIAKLYGGQSALFFIKIKRFIRKILRKKSRN